MSKDKTKISILLYKILFCLLSFLANLTRKNSHLIKAKLAIGTLLLAFIHNQGIAQEKTDTTILEFDVVLEEDTTIYDVIITCYYSGRIKDTKPTFPGGKSALNNAIYKNLRYPESALENNIEGKVKLSFVINKTGDIEKIKVNKGIGFGCNEEAIRILENLPLYNPGYNNSRPSTFNESITIEFILPKD